MATGESMAVLMMKKVLSTFGVDPYLASFIFLAALAWTFFYMKYERMAQKNLRNILGVILLAAALLVFIQI